MNNKINKNLSDRERNTNKYQSSNTLEARNDNQICKADLEK